MDELGINIEHILEWFPHENELPYVLVRVSDVHAKTWPNAMGAAVRRCYITDLALNTRALELGVARSDILTAKLPDPGSVMAGDFGEILVYFYQAAKEYPVPAIGPKKWRLKHDRTKPAPHSDVIHFVLPAWPEPSEQDMLLCSEVKAKSTSSNRSPIQDAIDGCAKDRTSRLARTLVWLRERALTDNLGSISLAHIDRFINAAEHPQATKKFRAIAVVCTALLQEELSNAPTAPHPEYTVVVIAVPELRNTYMSVFSAVHQQDNTPSTPAVTPEPE